MNSVEIRKSLDQAFPRAPYVPCNVQNFHNYPPTTAYIQWETARNNSLTHTINIISVISDVNFKGQFEKLSTTNYTIKLLVTTQPITNQLQVD